MNRVGRGAGARRRGPPGEEGFLREGCPAQIRRTATAPERRVDNVTGGAQVTLRIGQRQAMSTFSNPWFPIRSSSTYSQGDPRITATRR